MHVIEIWRYPIKSIGGERLAAVDLTELGIEGDRRWGVRDVETGNVLTARRTPKLLMATASVVDGLPVVTTADGEVMSGSLLVMSRLLSEWLGQHVELVAAGDEGGTFENPMNVETETDWVSWTGPAHAFHDSTRTRVSLVSSATLAGLGETGGSGAGDVRRFRINLVVDTGELSGAEDELVGEQIRVGHSVVLDVTKHIDRCIMVTRPQPGLAADLDVLKRVIRERNNLLGVGSLVEAGGTVQVGDQVALLSS